MPCAAISAAGCWWELPAEGKHGKPLPCCCRHHGGSNNDLKWVKAKAHTSCSTSCRAAPWKQAETGAEIDFSRFPQLSSAQTLLPRCRIRESGLWSCWQLGRSLTITYTILGGSISRPLDPSFCACTPFHGRQKDSSG